MKNLAYRFLTCSLALLLAINTAAAGRWISSCWDAPACGPVVGCEPVCEPIGCCPVETHWEPCCEPAPCVAASCDGCGAVEATGDCGCDSASGAAVVHESVATPTPAAEPSAPTEVYEPAPTAAFGGGFRSDNATAQEATADDAAPSDDWNAGFEEPAAEPIPAEELFAEPAEPISAPPAAEPAPEPADDLFGAPAEEAAAQPADDLFGEPAVEEPMEEEPIFGEPAEETTEEPAEDLFGEPAAEEPAEDLFAEPAAEEPMEDEGDLFGAPVEEPAEDLFAEPAAEEPAEDLFSEPAAEEPADDLFGAEEEPMEDEGDLFSEPDAEESADDLFGADEEPAEDDGGLFDEPAEAVEDAADDLFAPDDSAPEDEAVEDDLFGGFGAILSEPGGVDSVAQRTWIDNTGRFSTVGRLLAIDGGSIRLVKENGALATVPLSRLSQSDLEFVSRQSVAMHQAREHAIARGVTPGDDAKQARTADELPLRTAQL